MKTASCLVFLFSIIISTTFGLLDIAQNVCDFGNKELKCFVRTLQTDLNQAEDGSEDELMFDSLEQLKIICSDAFFYESILRPGHFSELKQLTDLSLDYCKIRHMPTRAFSGLSNLKSLKINSHNSEWSSILMDMDKDVFADLNNLIDLDLTSNSIWSLPLQTFCSMPRLKSLNMSRNHLLDITDLGLGLHTNNEADQIEACTTNLEELDLSKNFISSLRQGDLHQIGASLKNLHLGNNRLTYLSDDAFAGMKNLQVLNMADNQLAALPPTVFNLSGELQELHLQNNSLTLVTPELFDGLNNLVLLNLSHNAISSHLLTSDTFGGLTNLRILDLSHNRLTHWDMDLWSQMPHLEMLILDHNLISSFEGGPAMKNLKHLSLANNKINSFSHCDEFKQLQHLDLHGNELTDTIVTESHWPNHLEVLLLNQNQLKSIPTSLSSTLKTLDLGENQVESIPERIFDRLGNLSILRLASNQLVQLSNATFGNLSSLQVLDMASNRIEVIPHGTFVGLQELRGLRLDDNALTDLNGVMASLRHLQWLNVSTNQLNWFDYAFLPHTLQWLDISYNQVTELGNFYNLQDFALHTLEASHNQIGLLDESSLPAKSLQFVRLEHNLISKVNGHTLGHLEHLDLLDLRHNKIQSLSKESLVVRQNHKKAQVLLQGNPLVCDCHLEWLPSINEGNNHNNHVHVADLADLECQTTGIDQEIEILLINQIPRENFLCSYTTHCFDLCRCCDFYACDCRMQCPSGCTCQHDVTWGKNIITCSSRNQTNIPLLIPMDATSLRLDGNQYRHIGQQYFLGRQRVQDLYLNHSGVQTIGSHAFTGLSSLQTLDLSHNPLLRELQGQEFNGLKSLLELRLDHCGLVHINDLTFQPLEALQVLRLDGNLLTSFPVWKLGVGSTSLNQLTSLSLAQNVWSCGCDFIAPFNEFLETNIGRIVDYEDIQCVSEDAVVASRTLCKGRQPAAASAGIISKPFSNRAASSGTNRISAGDSSSSLELAAILVPALLSASVIIVGLLAICVFRRHIKSWLYAKSSEIYESRYNSSLGSSLPPHHITNAGVTSTANSDTNLFDVYISYAKADSDFVDQNLAPTLEHHGGNGSTYRLCLHHRDFPLPNNDQHSQQQNNFTSIYNAVTLATESSAKMLLVLSKAYLAQEWPQVKTAILDSLHKATAGGLQDKLVILCIDDINEADLRSSELLPYFQTVPVVKWGSPGFLNCLRFYLPEPVHATFQRNVTLRSIQQSYGGVGHHHPNQYQAQQQHHQEHLYHYIPADHSRTNSVQNSHLYHTLEPNRLMFGHPNMGLNSNKTSAKTNPTFVFKFDSPSLEPSSLVSSQSTSNSCHTHSLSTSSGQRLLPSPKEYIV